MQDCAPGMGACSRCIKAGLWILDWTHGLDYGLSFGLRHLMLPDVSLKLLFK